MTQVADKEVFISSVWWRDNEPFVRTVGNDKGKVKQAAMNAIHDAAQTAFDDSEPDEDKQVEDFEQDIRWSGVHAMFLSDIVTEREIPSLQPDYDDLVSGSANALLYLD